LSNITIIGVPPKCPDLNLAKNFWEVILDNSLPNRIFKSYDDLVDHCCDALKNFVDQPMFI
jgi:hypothetical protein